MPISKTAAQQLPGYLWDAIKGTAGLVYKPLKWTAQKAYKWTQRPGALGGKALGGAAKGLAWAGEQVWKNPKWAVPGIVGAGVIAYKNPIKTLNTYITHSDPRYDLTQTDGWTGIEMRKQSSMWEFLGNNKDSFAALGGALGAGMLVSKGLVAASDYVSNLSGTFEQKKLIKNLMETDPIIKNADPAQVMSFYKTICNMAPNLSVDVNMAKDLLHNFIKFGRIDMQSLKLMIEAEKAHREATMPTWLQVK